MVSNTIAYSNKEKKYNFILIGYEEIHAVQVITGEFVISSLSKYDGNPKNCSKDWAENPVLEILDPLEILFDPHLDSWNCTIIRTPVN